MPLALLNQARTFQASKSWHQAGTNLKLHSGHWIGYLSHSARQCSGGGGGGANSGAGVRAISTHRDTRQRRRRTIWVNKTSSQSKVNAFKPFEEISFLHQIVHCFFALNIARLHRASQDPEDSFIFEESHIPFTPQIFPLSAEGNRK